MNDIVKIGSTEIKINSDSLEPAQYFEILKQSNEIIDLETLEKQNAYIAEQIILADKAGQTRLKEKLERTRNILLSESILLASDFNTWISHDVIGEFITKVKPARTVKIIELGRYTRPIPEANIGDIVDARSLEVFDDLLVIFTDLTDKSMSNKRDQEFLKRNRDPIVIGVFKDTTTGELHDRCYVITSWEDEWCDLSLDKMLNQLPQTGYGRLKLESLTTLSNDEMTQEKPAGIVHKIFGKWLK